MDEFILPPPPLQFDEVCKNDRYNCAISYGGSRLYLLPKLTRLPIKDMLDPSTAVTAELAEISNVITNLFGRYNLQAYVPMLMQGDAGRAALLVGKRCQLE